MDTQFSILPFRPEDQVEVQSLILAGLAERWGGLDPQKNPDLVDIATTYREAHFLVARVGKRVVGTGALIPRSPQEAEVVRMSVAADLRKQGIGGLILQQLLRHARESGCQRVILETTAAWQDAIRFYQGFGFQITHEQGGDVYFRLDLI